MARREVPRQKAEQTGVRERLRRLLRLLRLLESGAAQGSPALAEQLNVSSRTVYRDIQLLKAEHFPIVYSHERGGYRLAAHGLQTLPALTPEELAALLQAGASGGLVLPEAVAEGCRQVALKHMDAATPLERVGAYELIANRLRQSDTHPAM